MFCAISFHLKCNDEDSASAACVATFENYQTNPEIEGGFRLCRWFTEKCRQHFDRLLAISIHIRRNWSATIQWEILPLHR